MRAGIALGSNLGDREKNIEDAIAYLRLLDGVGEPVKRSHIHETDPEGCEPGTPPFLNAVVEVEWVGEPQTLLRELRKIEQALGRPSRYPRNAPRIVDLDLLYIDDLRLATDQLVLPHPRMHMRRFVLEPLAEVSPERVLPNQTNTVAELLAALA